MSLVNELLTLDAAQALVLEQARPLPAERVPLAEAAGRWLAETAPAAVDLPPFPSSAMDGYAVRAADTPGTLPVAFRIAAGSPAGRPLQAGEAMGIATGGMVPEGADAVIQHEYVVETDNRITIADPVGTGVNIRPVGRDVIAGAAVVQAGVRLGPAQIGALAAAGVAEVACARRPRVAVLTTGTELREPGSPLGPGEVYEANGVMLASQLEAEGARVIRLAAVADDEDEHAPARSRGGLETRRARHHRVAFGSEPHDLCSQNRGLSSVVEEGFWRVAVRPGKPVSFGVRGATLVMSAWPGNPVCVAGGCELFATPRPSARFRARGRSRASLRRGRLSVSVARNAGRDESGARRARR
jgi:molybdopterin molybdotransferase